jgi:excinuclease UvrABC nuclease subunit
MDDWTRFKNISLENVPDIPCVYFLMNGTELTYIGQTSNLNQRIYKHLYSGFGKTPFDNIYYFYCEDRKERLRLEEEYVLMYNPKWNGYHGEMINYWFE